MRTERIPGLRQEGTKSDMTANILPEKSGLSEHQLISELTGAITQHQVDHIFAYGLQALKPPQQDLLELQVDTDSKLVRFVVHQSQPMDRADEFLTLAIKTILGPSWAIEIEK